MENVPSVPRFPGFYVGNDPVNVTDPTGQNWLSDLLYGVAAAVSIATGDEGGAAMFAAEDGGGQATADIVWSSVYSSGVKVAASTTTAESVSSWSTLGGILANYGAKAAQIWQNWKNGPTPPPPGPPNAGAAYNLVFPGAATGTSGLNTTQFANWMDSHALSRSTGYCARYCRQGMEAGGLNTKGHPVDAKDYGSFLVRRGAQVVPNAGYLGNQQTGDVVVIQPAPGHSSSGHIEMWDGTGWVSDFKQNRFSPYNGIQPSALNYRVYRFF